MDDGIDAIDQHSHRIDIAEDAGKPIDDAGDIVEAVAITAWPMPAAKRMPCSCEATHDVASEKAGRAAPETGQSGKVEW